MVDTTAQLEYLQFLKEWNDGSGFITAHSSGSTGEPKNIALSKSDMWKSALSTVKALNITRDSVIASALPMRSIATKMAVVRSIAAGCRYCPIPPSNNFELPERVDMLSVGPSQTDLLINDPKRAAFIRCLLVGGAPLSGNRERALIGAGCNVFETYGMTETCSNIALRHCPDTEFRANAGITFTTDSRNCLVVHAPGYSFDGITTNDIIELHSPTSFQWRGRYDNVINSGGIKIFPEELERELVDYIDAPYYVVGTPDPVWGTAAAVVIEGTDGQAANVRESLLSFPDRVRCPKRVMAVSQFRYTHTGKILRLPPDSL